MNKPLVLSVILSVVILNAAVASTTVFDDVPKDHWAYKAIEQVDTEGRLTYKNENIIVEKRLLSRYEFAVAIARLLVIGPNGSKIDIAKLQITEDQLVILNRLVDEFKDELGGVGVDTDAVKRDLRDVKPIKQAEPAKPKYPVDVPSDHWAYESVKRLYELGIFQGYPQSSHK